MKEKAKCRGVPQNTFGFGALLHPASGPINLFGPPLSRSSESVVCSIQLREPRVCDSAFSAKVTSRIIGLMASISIRLDQREGTKLEKIKRRMDYIQSLTIFHRVHTSNCSMHVARIIRIMCIPVKARTNTIQTSSLV